ncbi:hypothetical protein ID866_9349 [Astraeus odoratus]|nr:hypothetical protein ID866_9349 [Astraeus odoratus]
MRGMYNAMRWALVSVLLDLGDDFNMTTGGTSDPDLHLVECLALPCDAQHLACMVQSMIFFITSILCFVWRSGSTTDPSARPPLPPSAAIGPRILVSAFIILGSVYFMAIVKTLQRYGRA